MILESLINSNAWLLAQASARSWVDALIEMKVDKLVIILLFGTGLVSAIGYSIAKIIRAANGSSDDVDDLKTQIDVLEQRVAKLEQDRG